MGRKTKQRKPGDLKPAEYNPRQLTDEQFAQISASILGFGFLDPVIVNKHPTRLDHIIGGHQRVKVAQKLIEDGGGEVDGEWVGIDWNTVPTLEVELTIERERELNIRLNKAVGDWDILANEFEVSDLVEWGFTEGELDIHIDDPPGEDDFDETPPETPATKPGDLYEFNGHRLLCGDSTSASDVDRLIEGRIMEMLFTDPPYGVNYTGGIQFDKNGNAQTEGREKLENDNDAGIYAEFLPVVLPFIDGPGYVWFAGVKAGQVCGAVEGAGCVIHAMIIWHKTNATYAALNAQYKQRHEPCLYFKPQKSTLRWCGPTDERTVWEMPRDPRNDLHPTQKPVALAFRAMGNHEAKTVIDPFLGSGSTLIAAEQLDRTCYGMELSPAYCDVIARRWAGYMRENDRPHSVKVNGQDITDAAWLKAGSGDE